MKIFKKIQNKQDFFHFSNLWITVVLSNDFRIDFRKMSLVLLADAESTYAVLLIKNDETDHL